METHKPPSTQPPPEFPLKNAQPNTNTKSNKKRDPSQHTIDKKHSQMLEHFAKNDSEIIPKLKNQIRELEESLNSLGENETDRRLDITDQIQTHKTHIKKLRTEKKRYFLENSKYIFNYFEEKKRISSGEKQHVNVLNSFFKIKTEENPEKTSNLKHYINNY